MPFSAAEIAALPHVEAALHYGGPTGGPLRSDADDAPPEAPRNEAVYLPHAMPIHDVRPVAGRLSLDDQGMALLDHASTVTDFGDEDALRRAYYPETSALVKAATG